MRMNKVLLALRVIDRVDIELRESDAFDYGLGTGTFFKYCPPSTRLCGVEIDAQHVAAVKALHVSGHIKLDLRPIRITNWREHPLLNETHDVSLCSHALEHLEDPVDYLRTIRPCLKERGSFLGIFPINERTENPDHLHKVDRRVVTEWARAADLEITHYIEADPWIYWGHCLYTTDEGFRHRQVLGIPATALEPSA